jgi:radical SAM superfamily enzyme YgiQ (UPF0313 family)
MLDLLLIKPGSQQELYGELSGACLTAIEPPLWAGLLATFVRNYDCSVKILDAEVEKLNADQVVDRIIDTNPLLVAIVVSGTNPNASTMNMLGVRKILNNVALRGLKVKTLLIGLHPSALPEKTIKEEKVDYVCEGEGFYTTVELLKLLKRCKNNEDFDVKGLWYKKEEKVFHNERAFLIKDFPSVSWDLLPMNKYRAHNWHCFQESNSNRMPYGIIYTSLGCPFKCTFCCINTMFGGSGIRYRSPEDVVHEIDILVNKYNVKNIKIIDEMFVLNDKHVLEICDLIIDRNYNLNIWAYARINTISRKILEKLKEAGITWLAYGIESGNNRVLKSISKGITVESIRQAVQLTKDIGINIIGNYVFGFPEDDINSMKDTLALAIDLNCEFVNFYCAIAHPGSGLYEQAVDENWELPKTWSGYSPYSYNHLPLPTKYITVNDVLRFRDEAFVKYNSNSKYQKMILEKFGRNVLADINQKLTKKLRRKHIQ